jgi:hypothetical protein
VILGGRDGRGELQGVRGAERMVAQQPDGGLTDQGDRGVTSG